MIAPHLKTMANDHAGKLKVTKLNVDENNGTSMTYGVRSIPTLILFKDGEPVERIVGALPKHRIEEKVLPHLN
jgi:thioredoxin-like negative regulator of GroEL